MDTKCSGVIRVTKEVVVAYLKHQCRQVPERHISPGMSFEPGTGKLQAQAHSEGHAENHWTARNPVSSTPESSTELNASYGTRPETELQHATLAFVALSSAT
jgi:hypothetical protein